MYVTLSHLIASEDCSVLSSSTLLDIETQVGPSDQAAEF